MNKVEMWEFIKDNALLLITVIGGIVAAVGYPLGWVPQSVTLSVVVGLLTLLATSQILERQRRFARLESLVESGFQTTIESLRGVEVRFFETETAFFDYLTTRIRTAHSTIKYATLGPSPDKVSIAGENFYKARERVIASGKIRFNYLTMFNNLVRLERVERELEELAGKQYFVGYFDFPASIPMISFTVIDEEELIIGGHRTLYAPSEGTVSVLIRQRAAAMLFSDYFDLLWRHSIKLNERGIRRDLLDALRKKIAVIEQGSTPSKNNG